MELEPLKKLLEEEFLFKVSSWPSVGRDLEVTDPQRLKQAIKVARKYGNSLGIFPNGITPNISEAKQNVIEFDAGRFTLDRSVLVNVSKTEVHEAYVKYMTEVAVLMQKRMGNENANEQNYRSIFQDVLKFEKALANVSIDSNLSSYQRWL